MTIMIHKFVEHIPEDIDEGIIYVSIQFETVIHKCACGCGSEVVTPLSPAEWSLNFNGQTISLHPSIGNWSFSCKSHYWIRKNKVEWSSKWSDAEIDAVKKSDFLDKKAQYEKSSEVGVEAENLTTRKTEKKSILATLIAWYKDAF